MNTKDRNKRTEDKFIIMIIRLCIARLGREDDLHGQVGADWIFIAKKREIFMNIAEQD